MIVCTDPKVKSMRSKRWMDGWMIDAWGEGMKEWAVDFLTVEMSNYLTESIDE
jgi:hypothetical protein